MCYISMLILTLPIIIIFSILLVPAPSYVERSFTGPHPPNSSQPAQPARPFGLCSRHPIFVFVFFIFVSETAINQPLRCNYCWRKIIILHLVYYRPGKREILPTSPSTNERGVDKWFFSMSRNPPQNRLFGNTMFFRRFPESMYFDRKQNLMPANYFIYLLSDHCSKELCMTINSSNRTYINFHTAVSLDKKWKLLLTSIQISWIFLKISTAFFYIRKTYFKTFRYLTFYNSKHEDKVSTM